MKIISDNSMVGLHKPQTTVTIETNNSSFELPVGANLLDALLSTGHPVEYQCRGGYCGACRMEVIHGEVEYDDLPLAHLNGDEVLPCCCHVTEPLKLAVSRTPEDETQGNLFE